MGPRSKYFVLAIVPNGDIINLGWSADYYFAQTDREGLGSFIGNEFCRVFATGRF